MDIFIYSTTALLGLFAGILFGFIIGVKTVNNFYKDKIDIECKDYTPLEKLKNALLTFALVDIKMEDMSGLNYNYPDYNGDKFPALSGSSIVHACYSYIFNRNAFRNSIMYSKQYENKLDAIEKYLNKNLTTEDQTTEFFTSFCEKHNKCIDEYKDKDENENTDKTL